MYGQKWILEAKSGHEHTANVKGINHLFWDQFLLTLALKTRDMCHGTNDSVRGLGLIGTFNTKETQRLKFQSSLHVEDKQLRNINSVTKEISPSTFPMSPCGPIIISIDRWDKKTHCAQNLFNCPNYPSWWGGTHSRSTHYSVISQSCRQTNDQTWCVRNVLCRHDNLRITWNWKRECM